MDPDGSLVVRIIWDVFDTLFIGRRSSVFLSLFVVLVWGTVIGAIGLLEPSSLLQTALAGSGVCATVAAIRISPRM